MLQKFNEWRKEKGIERPNIPSLKDLDLETIDVEDYNIHHMDETDDMSEEEFDDFIAKSKESLAQNTESVVVEEPVEVVEEETDKTEAAIDLTEEQWTKIKGIGPKLAQRLMEDGPYDNIKAIEEVKGVSKAVLERIEELLEV